MIGGHIKAIKGALLFLSFSKDAVQKVWMKEEDIEKDATTSDGNS